ncbi:MAG TPA: hypothetical protein VFB98_07050 [Candidatus Deferrimicrobium sp.]|nr:hypothetical protein [Candidatus Deferrimicrobium sp.]
MSTAQRGNTREIWRRVLPVALVLAAVATAFVVTHEPLARVEVVDFTQEQQDLGSFYGLWTDEQKALKAMPLADYIASVTAGKTTVVDTASWATFAHGVSLSQEGNPPDRTWRRRIGEYGSVYVRQRDLPSPDLVAGLPDGEARYASLSDGTWVKAVAVRLSSSDFTLGSGLHGPPHSLAYPLRDMFFPLLGLAVLIYVLLPWPHRGEGIIAYDRWRVVLGDILGLVLTVMFVAMPFFITGNSALAVTEYWGLTLVFWLIGLLGLWAVQVGISAGGLQMMVLEDHLVRVTAWRHEEYAYMDMARVQPALQLPPQWLVRMFWIAVLTGRRGPGTALLGAQSETQGFRITMKDGRLVHIWLTDQMGSVMIRGADALPRALAAAGVPMSTESVTVRGMSVG